MLSQFQHFVKLLVFLGKFVIFLLERLEEALQVLAHLLIEFQELVRLLFEDRVLLDEQAELVPVLLKVLQSAFHLHPFVEKLLGVGDVQFRVELVNQLAEFEVVKLDGKQ